jgi:hypothetical protein
MTSAWKTNEARQLIAVAMSPPDQRSRGRADPAHPVDRAERAST